MLLEKNEKTAKLMAGGSVFSQSFTTRAKVYFLDCEEVISYLEVDLYDISNITELVEDYNLLCQE